MPYDHPAWGTAGVDSRSNSPIVEPVPTGHDLCIRTSSRADRRTRCASPLPSVTWPRIGPLDAVCPRT